MKRKGADTPAIRLAGTPEAIARKTTDGLDAAADLLGTGNVKKASETLQSIEHMDTVAENPDYWAMLAAAAALFGHKAGTGIALARLDGLKTDAPDEASAQIELQRRHLSVVHHVARASLAATRHGADSLATNGYSFIHEHVYEPPERQGWLHQQTMFDLASVFPNPNMPTDVDEDILKLWLRLRAPLGLQDAPATEPAIETTATRRRGINLQSIRRTLFGTPPESR